MDEQSCGPSARPMASILKRPRRRSGADPWIGRVLAERYKILSLIGEGSTARVYRGEALSVRRAVAIKLMPRPTQQADDHHHSAQRLAREIDALSRLHNPHIVSVVDLLEVSQDFVAVIMDLVDGTTLEHQIERQGPLVPPRACGILRQIATGLIEAHREEMIHRDLKPENLMLQTMPDGGDFIKILDFGIVHLQDTNQQAMTNGFIGTPLYASPEQFRSDPIDHRSDIYSLGAVLFFLLTGRPPFPSDNVYDLYIQHVRNAPPLISEVAPARAFDPRLVALVDRMLAKDPDHRPCDLAAVIAALEELQTPAGGGVSPPPKCSSRASTSISCSCVCENGSFAIVADTTGEALLFEPHRSSPLSFPVASAAPITAMALIDAAVFVGHGDGVVTRTNIEDLHTDRIFSDPGGDAICALDVDPQGTWVGVALNNGQVLVNRVDKLSTSSWQQICRRQGVRCLALRPSCLTAVVGSEHSIDALRLDDPSSPLVRLPVDRPPRAVALSRDGYLLLSISDEGIVSIVEIPTGRAIAELCADDTDLLNVDFLRDGGPVAVGVTGQTLRLIRIDRPPTAEPRSSAANRGCPSP